MTVNIQLIRPVTSSWGLIWLE